VSQHLYRMKERNSSQYIISNELVTLRRSNSTKDKGGGGCSLRGGPTGSGVVGCRCLSLRPSLSQPITMQSHFWLKMGAFV
jgi:hypothetical protein